MQRLDPGLIEVRSLEIVRGLLRGLDFPGPEREVAIRVVHATGDPGLAAQLRFHPRAGAEGVRGLRAGCSVFTDVEMVRAGIDRRRLANLGGEVLCLVDDPEVITEAGRAGCTRAAAAMRTFGHRLDAQVVAIGNAPTALVELCGLIELGGVRPALVVGTPVGFVGALEAKELLQQTGVPFITLPGIRGGSPIAAAIVNALLRLAERGEAG